MKAESREARFPSPYMCEKPMLLNSLTGDNSSVYKWMNKARKHFVRKPTQIPKSPIKTSHTHTNASINIHVKFDMLGEEIKWRSYVCTMLPLCTQEFRVIFSPANSMSESKRPNSD